MRLVSLLPEPIKPALRFARDGVRRVLYRGTGRYCPVCEKSSRKFASFGIVPRSDAQCVMCGSLERHRLTWVFLTQKTDLFDGQPKCVLHVAPEREFEKKFRSEIQGHYVTADLFRTDVSEQMDICEIAHPSATFDVIYCSHVLEHVVDDRKAMREFHRVLKLGGWAILNVPVTSDETFEDPKVTDPNERLRLFGQKDHVRRYGPDYIHRLRDSGFSVDVISVADLMISSDAERMGLANTGSVIYYCEKVEIS